MSGVQTSWAVMVALFVSSVTPTIAQPNSQQVCAAAQQYLAQSGIAIGEEGLFASGAISPGSTWVQVSQFIPPSLAVTRGGNIYLAYFFNRMGSEPTGAVSVKVSVYQTENTEKANRVELYRSAIERGTNRCESGGRLAFDDKRGVSVKEYVDYHWRQGSNDVLETRFHFRYPFRDQYGTNRCARTDQPAEVAATYQFPGTPSPPNNLFARILVGQAYAFPESFSRLRSELHYYNRGNGTISCVGFTVPLNGVSRQA